MKITIIGSGTGVPRPDRASPCLMIETRESTILCDTGPGTLRQLSRAGKALNDIDLIIYSHFHIDHIADLIPFIFACKYTPGQIRTRDITIMGHPGIKKLFSNLTEAYGKWVIPDNFQINWIEAGNNMFQFEDFTIKTARVNHIDSSIAIRVENSNSRVVTYSGDTDYCSGIIQLGKESDLLVLECSFPENMKCEGHLIPSLAGKIACESRCKKLLLTHFYPPCDQTDVLSAAQKEYGGRIIKAEDLMQITI